MGDLELGLEMPQQRSHNKRHTGPELFPLHGPFLGLALADIGHEDPIGCPIECLQSECWCVQAERVVVIIFTVTDFLKYC